MTMFFFSDIEDRDIFYDAQEKMYEKVALHVIYNNITKRLEYCNAICLADFTECYFRDEHFVYGDI